MYHTFQYRCQCEGMETETRICMNRLCFERSPTVANIGKTSRPVGRVQKTAHSDKGHVELVQITLVERR